MHGCSVADDSPYPMLHVMGPRDGGSTAEAGWARGYRFGVAAGTDHHGAYPGSHGDGRMGVFASALTRESIWEAFLARRVFAATGDRIDTRLFVDDAWMGSELRTPGDRHIRMSVRGSDSIRLVELYKNGCVLHRFFPVAGSNTLTTPYRLRVTWGWGGINDLVAWQARFCLSDGTLSHIETCFHGDPVVAPRGEGQRHESPDDADVPHAILERNDSSCVWESRTRGNPTMRHATTQAISFEIDAPIDASVVLEVNGHRYEHRLAELAVGARCHFLRGLAHEAVRIGPLVPVSRCTVTSEFRDTPERDVDYYRLQVSQHNGQWAWSTPVWVRQ